MPKPQSYSNHVFFYPAHHFAFLPISAILTIVAGYRAWAHPESREMWIGFTAVLFLITWLAVMLRQHYALGLQNRIVRVEMRQRYYELTGKRFEPLESQLGFGQIAALRFAPDEELEGLLEAALREKLSGKDIKQKIKNWKGDYFRV